ncbi:MAG: extracellular solute-binding protein [Calditrichaeota bacterium]|nr:extracellular solute-binding protein [Calditrichota bacterium]
MMKFSKLFFLLSIFFLLNCSRDDSSTIKFTHIYDPLGGPQGKLNVDWIDARVENFEQKHPAFSVEMEQAKWDQIDSKSMSDFRAGIRHDVLLTSPQILPKHALVGDLLDLSPFLTWTKQQIAEFSWSPVWSACVYNGRILGIPMGAHTRLCVYNKEMFRQAGLDPEKPPRSLDELISATQKLTRDLDGDGKIDVWGLGIYFGPSRATIELAFAPILWHFGGKLWNEKTKRAVFASPEGVKTVKFLRDLIYKYRVTPPWVLSGAYDDVVLRGFLNEKFAIAWGWGSYWIQPLEQKGWIKNCFPPTPEAEMVKAGIFLTPTNPQAQFTNAWTISVHSLAKNPKVSSELLKEFVTPETLKDFPDAGLPGALSVWQGAEYQSDFYQIWFQAIKLGRSMPQTAHYEELANTVAAALQEILVKNANPGKTLQKFQRAYNIRYAGE